LLLACCRPNYDLRQVSGIVHGGLNWTVVFDLAEEHSVLGVLALRLQEIKFDGVDPEARDKLQARMRSQHMFTLSMTAELFHILDEFARHGIETLLVKGPVISLLAYGDSAVRSYVDLDLLVRNTQILKASQAMTAMGFDADVPESAIVAGKVPGEYLFTWPGTQRLIELHTPDTFRYYRKPMRIDDLFARRRTLPLDAREIPALSLEDELVLNCIHGGKHFWERLMWVSDIAAVVTRHPEIDWAKAQRAAADVGAERMLLVGLHLGQMLLGVTLPPQMAEKIREDGHVDALCRQVAEWLPLAGYAPPGLVKRALFRMGMGGGGWSGATYLARLSVSPTEEDWQEGAEDKRSWLWDAIRRPFRLIRKYGQGG
jgi:Uncharacterised nucleotidyltransferase